MGQHVRTVSRASSGAISVLYCSALTSYVAGLASLSRPWLNGNRCSQEIEARTSAATETAATMVGKATQEIESRTNV
jgi:hypothetical protein